MTVDTSHTISGVTYEARFGLFAKRGDEWISIRDLPRITQSHPEMDCGWFARWTVPGLENCGPWAGPRSSQKEAIQLAEDDFMGSAAEPVPELPDVAEQLLVAEKTPPG